MCEPGTFISDLEDGLLIYAAGESAARTVVVPMAGKRLRIATLGLQGSPTEILREVAAIGEMIAALRVDSASRICESAS